MLWHLVVEHYQIPEAEVAAQMAQQQRRDEAEAGFEQAHLVNGNDPRINAPADWIPDYPPGPDDEADDPQDSAGWPEQPAGDQRDSPAAVVPRPRPPAGQPVGVGNPSG